jgi:hypothetical protein
LALDNAALAAISPPPSPPSLASDAAAAHPPPTPSASEVAMRAEADATAADTVCNTKSANDELDRVAELSKLLSESAESKQSGDQGKVVAVSFRMNTLENNEQASL